MWDGSGALHQSLKHLMKNYQLQGIAFCKWNLPFSVCHGNSMLLFFWNFARIKVQKIYFMESMACRPTSSNTCRLHDLPQDAPGTCITRVRKRPINQSKFYGYSPASFVFVGEVWGPCSDILWTFLIHVYARADVHIHLLEKLFDLWIKVKAG